MPITQSRMISLISAAETFQQSFEELSRFIQSQVQSVKSGAATAEEALALIFALAENPTSLMSNPIQAYSVLATEKEHFRLNHRANDKAKLRKQWKRASGAGTSSQSESEISPDDAIAQGLAERAEQDLAAKPKLGFSEATRRLIEAELRRASASEGSPGGKQHDE